MRRLLIIGLLLMPAPARADVSASFDCAKAESTVEKSICADTNYLLAYRDGMLGRLFAALKEEGGHDDVLSGQKAWLKQRNACKADVQCLSDRYDERIAVLAEAAGDDEHLTGTYRYKNAEYESDGLLWVFRDMGGTLTGRIETVTGPTAHTCDIEFDQASPTGRTWVWTDPEEDGEGKHCNVRFDQGPKSFRISSENCAIYCGVAGYFDDTYKRAK